MEQSILKSTKNTLGVGDDDTSFDQQLLTHINLAFSVLTDLGIGPQGGFVIEDESTEWAEYFPEETDPAKLKVQLSKVKSVIFLRVRLLWDPPNSGFLLDAVKAQLTEAEWRLNVNREETEWVDPNPPDDALLDAGDSVGVYDGGDPTGV
jgi:hypothetical protein